MEKRVNNVVFKKNYSVGEHAQSPFLKLSMYVRIITRVRLPDTIFVLDGYIKNFPRQCRRKCAKQLFFGEVEYITFKLHLVNAIKELVGSLVEGNVSILGVN